MSLMCTIHEPRLSLPNRLRTRTYGSFAIYRFDVRGVKKKRIRLRHCSFTVHTSWEGKKLGVQRPSNIFFKAVSCVQGRMWESFESLRPGKSWDHRTMRETIVSNIFFWVETEATGAACCRNGAGLYVRRSRNATLRRGMSKPVVTSREKKVARCWAAPVVFTKRRRACARRLLTMNERIMTRMYQTM